MEKSEIQLLQQEQEDRHSSPSLYAQYQYEIEGIEVIEYDWGFLTYKIHAATAHCIDTFISKEYRDGNKRRELFKEFIAVAKARGASHIVGNVDVKIPASTRRIAFWIRIGAEIYSAKDDLIYFIKRI